MFELNRQWRARQAQAEVDSQQRSADQVQRDIYETHRHRVFSLSYYMTANEIEAETMLEATFIQAFSTSPTPDAQGVDTAFLRELEERFTLRHEAWAIPQLGTTLQRGNVRRTEMEESLGELPPRERLVFLLHDVEGYKPARIAALLDDDEAQVFRTLISARIRMRNLLTTLRSAEVVPGVNSEQVSEVAETTAVAAASSATNSETDPSAASAAYSIAPARNARTKRQLPPAANQPHQPSGADCA